MHISALKKSNFLTRAECGRGILVTAKNITQENVAKEGASEELRYCLYFDELEKPLVLNNTNAQIIAGITHCEDTDGWTGAKLVLYDDPNVTFGGKLVGGIRVRAPRIPQAKPAAQPTHGILGKPHTNQPIQPIQPPPTAPLEGDGPSESDDVPF